MLWRLWRRPPNAAAISATWNAAFQSEAAAKGISQRALAALNGLTPDPQVLSLDRRQGHFSKTFEDFGAPRIAARMAKAQGMMQKHGALLSRIEQQYGVPGAVVIAIWALETDFGVVQGKQNALRSLATLAHDCRRTERFQNELLDALRIIDRGDLSPAEMRGAWAGELGQTQFLPSSYLKFAVDFDGNGKRDLIRSVPDVLAFDRELSARLWLAARRTASPRARRITPCSRNGTSRASIRRPSPSSPRA